VHQRIGSYRIERVLAEGGMGLVYKGRHESLSRDAAIKTLLPKDAGDAALRQRLLREAQAQARLQHPNIVSVYDLIDEKGELFIAMELVEGGTLEALLQQRPHGRLPLAEGLPLFEQVLGALEFVHGERIVHRDVKPSNVIVCGSRVKLADFGIALLGDLPRMTASMHLVGSPPYMSPEQLEGKRVDHRTDIYSAALVLYRILAGRPPFEAKEYLAQVQERVAGPPALRALVPELSSGFCDALAVALRYDREQRFASVAAFREALREGAAGFLFQEAKTVETPAVAAEVPAEPLVIAPEPEPRSAVAVVAFVIAGAFLAAVAVLTRQLDRQPFPVAAPPQKLTSMTPPPLPIILEAPAPAPSPVRPEPEKRLAAEQPAVKKKPREDEEQRGLVSDALREVEALRQQVQLGLKAAEAEIETRAREAEEALWASRLQDIENELRAERWPEAKRFATRLANDPRAPEAVVARANALLQQAEDGLKDALKDIQFGPTTNTSRKPSSPPRKDR